MTRNDAFIEAHAKAYEGLPDGVVFNLWESNVDLQSENTSATFHGYTRVFLFLKLS